MKDKKNREELNEKVRASESAYVQEAEPAEAESAEEALEGFTEEDIVLKLQEELADMKDQLLRKQADFENYKKRMIKLQEDNRKLALRDIALDIVQINDDLLRALDASVILAGNEGGAKESYDSFLQGVLMISKRIESVLEKYGVSEIDALDQEFDPNFHEAIEIDMGNVERDAVTFVYQKGYTINDMILRNAKVRVTKPEKKNEKKTTEDHKDSEIH
ncbi:MAG: nucleotide exchange factor GrpE [Leptospirales bacterium]|nr:nucleotide exchange factor GrpE [Leptospirales bacterium]